MAPNGIAREKPAVALDVQYWTFGHLKCVGCACNEELDAERGAVTVSQLRQHSSVDKQASKEHTYRSDWRPPARPQGPGQKIRPCSSWSPLLRQRRRLLLPLRSSPLALWDVLPRSWRLALCFARTSTSEAGPAAAATRGPGHPVHPQVRRRASPPPRLPLRVPVPGPGTTTPMALLQSSKQRLRRARLALRDPLPPRPPRLPLGPPRTRKHGHPRCRYSPAVRLRPARGGRCSAAWRPASAAAPATWSRRAGSTRCSSRCLRRAATATATAAERRRCGSTQQQANLV